MLQTNQTLVLLACSLKYIISGFIRIVDCMCDACVPEMKY